MKKIRKRDTIGLSEEGKNAIEEARKKQGWKKNSLIWYKKALSSAATLKRFQNGTKIEKGAFIALCKAIGLTDWESLVNFEDKDSRQANFSQSKDISLATSPPEHNPKGDRISFMLTGSFTEDKKAEIELVIEHLKELLLDNCDITLRPEENSLFITGSFSQEIKPEVEIALQHLESLLLKFKEKIKS